MVRSYRFTNIGQVLRYYATCNPARYKPVNLFEPENRSAKESWAIEISRYDGPSDTLDGPEALWNLVRILISKTLKQYDRQSVQVKAFTLCYLLPAEDQMGVDDIVEGNYPPNVSEHLRIPRCGRTTIYKYLREIKEELERAGRLAYLLPPDDSNLE